MDLNRFLPKYVSILVLALITPLMTPAQAQPKSKNCENISERDARILLYLIPDAFEMRNKGDDVVFDREVALEKTLPGKFAYTLYGAKPNPAGSTLVGHFAVDRCSGEISNASHEEIKVSSRTLSGVKRIMISR